MRATELHPSKFARVIAGVALFVLYLFAKRQFTLARGGEDVNSLLFGGFISVLFVALAWKSIWPAVRRIPSFEAGPNGFRVMGGKLYSYEDYRSISTDGVRIGLLPMPVGVKIKVRGNGVFGKKLWIPATHMPAGANSTMEMIARLMQQGLRHERMAALMEIGATQTTAQTDTPWGTSTNARPKGQNQPSAHPQQMAPAMTPARAHAMTGSTPHRKETPRQKPFDGGPIKSSRGLFARKVI